MERFTPFLTRVISHLGTAAAASTPPFSPEEGQQLKQLFNLSTEEELEQVLGSCSYVFEQAAFTSTNPEALYGLLLEQAGFDEPHAKALGRVWAAEAPAFISRLKARTLGGPTLVDTDYPLNIIMGESSLTRLQESTALFEFTVAGVGDAGADSSSAGESRDGVSGSKKIGVEFSHPELYSFFSQLERIQAQLDNLS